MISSEKPHLKQELQKDRLNIHERVEGISKSIPFNCANCSQMIEQDNVKCGERVCRPQVIHVPIIMHLFFFLTKYPKGDKNI